MSYELMWHIPDQVMLLKLSGSYAIHEAKNANYRILEHLEQANNPLMILIDAMDMKHSYNFDEIRKVQSFMNHQNLSYIFVASNDRLVKLSMMVIFNFSKAYLHIFDDTDKADLMIRHQLKT